MTIGLAILATTTFASANTNQKVNKNQQQAAEAQKTNTTQPVAAIRIFDISGKSPKLMEGNQLSRSKARQMCVFVVNVEVKNQNRLVEYFKTPEPMLMQAEGATTQSSQDGKEHFITFNLPKSDIKNYVVSQCWKFNKEHPMGIYQLDVQFNDIVFKGLSFEILK